MFRRKRVRAWIWCRACFCTWAAAVSVLRGAALSGCRGTPVEARGCDRGPGMRRGYCRAWWQGSKQRRQAGASWGGWSARRRRSGQRLTRGAARAQPRGRASRRPRSGWTAAAAASGAARWTTRSGSTWARAPGRRASGPSPAAGRAPRRPRARARAWPVRAARRCTSMVRAVARVTACGGESVCLSRCAFSNCSAA